MKSVCIRTKLRARRSERGAVIFIVIMVLTILTAIGVFSVRAAGLNQNTSGYARQSTQAGYLAQYGMLAAIKQVEVNPAMYTAQSTSSVDQCSANAAAVEAGVTNPECYKLYPSDVQKALTESSGGMLFDPTGTSFGATDGGTSGFFVVEITDILTEGAGAGDNADPSASKRPVQSYVFTSTGQVRPIGTGSGLDQGTCSTAQERAAAQTAGVRSYRAAVKY